MARGRSGGKNEGGGGNERASSAADRISFAALYATGQQLGYTPREVDCMTHWELLACADGFKRAHGVRPALQPPTDEEFDAWVAGNA